LVILDHENSRKYSCDSRSDSLIVKTPFVSVQNNLLGSGLKSPTAEEVDFIQRNSEADTKNQTKRGWFFFHHGYNFGPMNALSLGASPEKQTMVYGWLSTVTQGKVLETLGMTSYQGYFKAFFSIYIIYYTLFGLGIWLIYKDFGTAAFAGVLAVSAVLVLGVELIKLAPGFNPVRHLFDVPTFYLLYRYLHDKQKKYLFAAITLSLFSILWNKDFGLFLTVSAGCALVFYGMQGKPVQRLPIVVGIMAILIGFLIFLYPMPGSNPTAIYMLLGVGSPAISSKQIFNMLLLIGVMLLASVWIKQNRAYKTLTIGVALYFVQSLTYYIWYPEWHHLWGVAPIFILWIVALYHGWISQCQDSKKASIRQVQVIVLMLLLIYIPSVVHFSKDQKSYWHQFENHQLYQWTFERGTFESTMDPSLFEEAVGLITQHSSENEIYIISKYDHVLPILAGRYSAMPYNELLTNLVSPREASFAAKAIIDANPRFIFVDSDIGHGFTNNSHPNNVADSAAMMAATYAQEFYSEAVARERILGQLNDVFLGVADKYVKCKTGGLISVYCRKSS